MSPKSPVSFFVYVVQLSDSWRDQVTSTNSLLLIFWFLPTGGWTPAASVQTQCVLLHLSRKASKSETAPPSVAAEWSQREPKREHVIEHATVQVSSTEHAKDVTRKEKSWIRSFFYIIEKSHKLAWLDQRIKSTIKSLKGGQYLGNMLVRILPF